MLQVSENKSIQCQEVMVRELEVRPARNAKYEEHLKELGFDVTKGALPSYLQCLFAPDTTDGNVASATGGTGSAAGAGGSGSGGAGAVGAKGQVAKEAKTAQGQTRQRTDVRKLLHLQYAGWPDKGVPANPSLVLEIVHIARSYQQELDPPLLVHCRSFSLLLPLSPLLFLISSFLFDSSFWAVTAQRFTKM